MGDVLVRLIWAVSVRVRWRKWAMRGRWGREERACIEIIYLLGIMKVKWAVKLMMEVVRVTHLLLA